jgi:hypothetical protein
MPTLSPGDWMTLFGIAATALSAAVAVREQTKGLKEGQAEMLRQIGAVGQRSITPCSSSGSRTSATRIG